MTGLPETGESGEFGSKTEMLEFFSHVVFGETENSVFLIAANDGQLVDTWSRLNRADHDVDETGRLLEHLLFNDRQEKEGSRLKLFNLSRLSSAILFDRALNALVDHEGWKDCYDEAETDDGLFGVNCPIRHNYELLKQGEITKRLRDLLELCDHNEVHFSIRRLLLLLANAVLGFAGKEAGGKNVPDHLLRAIDVPRVISSKQVLKCSIYNNIFGGNLTRHRRSSLDIFEYLGRFRIGYETSNRFDNLLIYGNSDIDLAEYFERYLSDDRFYGAGNEYLAAQSQYIEGADESDEETDQFLELLVAQRRGLFFKIGMDSKDELSPWDLTVFNFAGEYLDRVVYKLRNGRRVDKYILSRLALGLNRVFVGMLISSDQEIWLATGLSGSNSKVSCILSDRVSVARRAKESVTIFMDEAKFPVLRVSFDDENKVDLSLTLIRFEFLSRVAEGVLPGSFSKECHEDILAFKSRLLSAAKERLGPDYDEESTSEFRLVELDETGHPREKTVEVEL